MPVRRRLHSFYALLPVLDLDLSTVCNVDLYVLWSLDLDLHM